MTGTLSKELAPEGAAPERFVRIFLDKGVPLVSLLMKVRRDSPQYPYAQHRLTHVHRGLQEDLTPKPAQRDFAEPLSDRELEVLQFVAQGLTNQEIAERLFISVGTAKKHIEHIHGKLGVSSRTHAVARARVLNLI